MNEIRITCDVDDRINYKTIKPFQGAIKSLSVIAYNKLKSSILEEGFFAPIYVWIDKDNTHYCLDGHQRLFVLDGLEKEGVTVPLIPIVRVQAPSFHNAKKKLLYLVSQYGKVEDQGFYEFVVQNTIDLDFINTRLDIPGLDTEHFIENYFNNLNKLDDVEIEPKKNNDLKLEIVFEDEEALDLAYEDLVSQGYAVRKK